MKKKLFKNYNYEFDKNESKVLVSFCKQALKQMEGDEKYFSEVKAFNSIIQKIGSDSSNVKLTKGEKNSLTLQIKENTKHLKSKMDKGWFLTKWLYKSMHTQYNNLLIKHFSD